MLSILSTGLLSTGLVASYRYPLPLQLQRLAVRARTLSMADNDQGVAYAVQKSEAEWREGLSDMEYRVLRQKGTERPGSGEYNKFAPEDGHFVCAGCEQALYSAAAKFETGCGWPAFDKIVEGAVVTMTDRSLGMSRVEIMCGGCGGHLGHVFEGEKMTATNERHCVNSVSVKYVKAPLGEGKTEKKVLPEREEVTASSILGQLFGNNKD
jgi:peptide-methionine (R)-S-oxide reductase